MPRYYGGSYYGPRVLPKKETSMVPSLLGAGIGFAIGGPAGALKGAQIAGGVEDVTQGNSSPSEAVGTYIGQQRQTEQDDAAREERDYTRGRRATMDPMIDADARARLYNQGVDLPDDGQPSALGSAVDEQRTRGDDLLSGRGQFGDGGSGRPATGVFAPGSFNPGTGGFNPPMAPDAGSAPTPRRVPLGGGYNLDPSRTEEGRKESLLGRHIDLAVGQGIPRDEAELELRSRGGLDSEHFHPGSYHPKTKADADAVAQREHTWRLEEIRAREAGRNKDKDAKDPRFKERRDAWEKELGKPPTSQLQQDMLDALAWGYSTDEILKSLSPDRQAEAKGYLRRAIGHERRRKGLAVEAP